MRTGCSAASGSAARFGQDTTRFFRVGAVLGQTSQARKQSRIELPERSPLTTPLPEAAHRVTRRGRLFGLLLKPERIVRGVIANITQHRSRNGKEVGGLTVMVAHSPLEDFSLEEEVLFEAGERTTPDFYEIPVAELEHVERETESYVAWVIVLGFVAYAIALYWAHKCERRGGDPIIKFSLVRGFIVRCIR
jgi:hypothetical protein